MKRRTFFGALFKSGALALLPSVAVARIADRTMALSGVPAISACGAAGIEKQLGSTVPSDAYTAAIPEPISVSNQSEIATRTLLLQTSPVAGFQYRQGQLPWALMRRGDWLALVREPDNGYDDKAVRIGWDRFKLGYVPRIENRALSQMLDRGERLVARIVQLRQSGNPWKRVQVAIEVVV